MNPVILDTDVASHLHRRKLAGPLSARLVGREPLITFVIIAELTKWAEIRAWGTRRPAACLRANSARAQSPLRCDSATHALHIRASHDSAPKLLRVLPGEPPSPVAQDKCAPC
jgi:predicted nucleic acid-binding protein